MRDNEAPQGAEKDSCVQGKEPQRFGTIAAADLPSDADLVRRAIEHLRIWEPKRAGSRRTTPLWSRVGFVFGHGSGYSAAICLKYGFNPDEIYRPRAAP